MFAEFKILYFLNLVCYLAFVLVLLQWLCGLSSLNSRWAIICESCSSTMAALLCARVIWVRVPSVGLICFFMLELVRPSVQPS